MLLPGLRRILPQALDSVSVISISKYFCKAHDYEKAYRNGHMHAAGKEVENVVKRYKSHRRVFDECVVHHLIVILVFFIDFLSMSFIRNFSSHICFLRTNYCL